jgi:hypothetical protein
MSDEDRSTIQEFKEVVNMSAKKLEDWLKTERSKEVGFKDSDGGESVGHKSGKRIIELLAKQPDEYTTDDLHHAKKVVGYIHRHLAQKPKGDITETPWRYSLMNWGHDPQLD